MTALLSHPPNVSPPERRRRPRAAVTARLAPLRLAAGERASGPSCRQARAGAGPRRGGRAACSTHTGPRRGAAALPGPPVSVPSRRPSPMWLSPRSRTRVTDLENGVFWSHCAACTPSRTPLPRARAVTACQGARGLCSRVPRTQDSEPRPPFPTGRSSQSLEGWAVRRVPAPRELASSADRGSRPRPRPGWAARSPPTPEAERLRKSGAGPRAGAARGGGAPRCPRSGRGGRGRGGKGRRLLPGGAARSRWRVGAGRGARAAGRRLLVCLLPRGAGPRVTPAPCLPSEALLQERQPQQQHHQQLRAQQQQQPELRRRQQRQQHLQQEQLRLHARHGGGPHGRHGHPQPVHALPRDAAEPVHQAAGPVRRAGTCGRAAAASRWLRSAAAVACGPGPRSSGLEIDVSRDPEPFP